MKIFSHLLIYLQIHKLLILAKHVFMTNFRGGRAKGFKYFNYIIVVNLIHTYIKYQVGNPPSHLWN